MGFVLHLLYREYNPVMENAKKRPDSRNFSRKSDLFASLFIDERNYTTGQSECKAKISALTSKSNDP